ncbi:Lrp/AsnC family transcriptional regulator [Muricoccus pecuniae]|uniref:Lrp/AsnC family leucine-responsive transcriptional regulator n=1 Tax=Muricoccus pecuniae TaxID=693023 RepID=A0A840Y3W5_9PROT|nr:Lrp/AsnC family transcriptional regulator [Roseomonas pecuniae]MBB5695828.1 Lrp/AsnC family leucine-responsive transcriptional regulator [Roseomonas pecuniae]
MAAEEAAPMGLDAVDRQLLRLVQKDARLSAERLAEAVELSASAVQRRLQALRRGGVIVGEVAVVNPRRVGRPLTMLVEIQIERERPELLGALRRWLSNEEAVQQAWYTTGEADFMLVVTAASVEGFDAFMERLLADNRNVRKFKTGVALQVTKRSLFVPVDPD